MRHTIPSFQSNLHLFKWMATKRKTMDRSSVLEMKTSPELLTSTGLLVSTKAVLMNQGRPRHSMSKTLEPTMLDMAMSDFPGGAGRRSFSRYRTHTVPPFQSSWRVFTFSGHHHAGHGVGDTGPSSQQGEPHDGVGDAEGLSWTGTDKTPPLRD